MTNTNPTPAPEAPRLARAIPKPTDFVPIDHPADRSRNGRRGSRSTRARRWVL